MKKLKFHFIKKKWPLFLILFSFFIPLAMGHYLYKNNFLYELGNVSHGKILNKKLYVEVNKKRIYKWTILKIGNKENNYHELKSRQLFYNSQLLLNKNQKKINTQYANAKNIVLKKERINKNLLNKSCYIIIDPNSRIIMQYNKDANLKHIISDIKRLLQYARF